MKKGKIIILLFVMTFLALSSIVLIPSIPGDTVFGLEGEITQESISSVSGINYQTHVQDIGWQDMKNNGQMSGTSGKGLRLEGIKISLSNMPSGIGIRYQTHVQNIGWQAWKYDGEMSGTSGKELRLEGIKIELVNVSEGYHVEYRVHVQDYGWQAWKRDGAMAGTSAESKRLEGIEIKIVKDKIGVSYKTHVENEGWQEWKSDGAMSGTSGKSYRLEGINIKLTNAPPGTSINYSTHIQNIGWQAWQANGEMSGTTGESLRLEGIKIQLQRAPQGYHVKYRVHIQDFGWQEWKLDGQIAGTSGKSKRLEGIEIIIINDQEPTDQEQLLVEKISGVGNAQQVITVTNQSAGSKQVTINAFQKSNEQWQRIYTMPGVIGYGGFATNKSEGDGKSPIGIYTLGTAMGIPSNPGTNMPYRQITQNDYWVDDVNSSLYNTWQQGPANGRWQSAEKMYNPLYNYGFVINYNKDRTPGKGSAIFMHVWRSSLSGTAGCTAASQQDVITLLKWINPSQNPIIIQGTENQVSSM